MADQAPAPDPHRTTPQQNHATLAALNASLDELLGVLDLVPTSDPDLFEGRSIRQLRGRVYGGQVLAQALLAAGRTVSRDRLPHSMHGYFLRPGDADKPIALAVERLNDARSFSARRTHAIQNGAPILSMIASFQVSQPGLDVAASMPEVPPPDAVPSALDVLGPIDDAVAQFWAHHAPFEIRHIGGSLYLGPAAEPRRHQAVWMRTRSPIGDDQLLHRALMAYACDQVMLEPILRAGGASWATAGMSIASLDHAMWWHRDARVDEWLLYVQSAESAQGGRGLGTARVFAQDGTLVASIAQEGMIRIPLGLPRDPNRLD